MISCYFIHPMNELDERRRPAGWRFDFVSADEAAVQLELTAQALLEAVAAVEHEIPVTTEDFTGRLREVFDVEAARHTVGARLLADDMVAVAAQVRARAVLAAATWAP